MSYIDNFISLILTVIYLLIKNYLFFEILSNSIINYIFSILLIVNKNSEK